MRPTAYTRFVFGGVLVDAGPAGRAIRPKGPAGAPASNDSLEDWGIYTQFTRRLQKEAVAKSGTDIAVINS